MKSTLIRNAMVVTVDPRNRVFQGDVFISDGRIAAFDFLAEADEVIDGTGQVLLPGFVQTHIHLCQTLFRGAADDLPLLAWLQQRVWPMEAAHTPESISASAALGIAELIKGGTTCALTMETVRNTAQVFEVAARSGFRATIGKCLMDTGTGVPAALLEDADSAILESVSLLERWHGSSNGRVSVCLAPRFALSCSKALLEKTAELAAQRGILVHTHASESRQEVDLVRASTGLANIEFLDSMGLVGPNVVLAHCIWVDESEREILLRKGAKVSHCPSSNLKLGSGIAPVVEMLEQGINVSLGADGAPCNNRLDMFAEMRTAALLQKVRRGPDALPAATALRMATIEGARAIGRGDEIGSIEIGKRADLILLSLDQLHCLPHPDLVSAIVYSAQPNQVETVLIDGNVVMRDRRLLTLDEDEVKRNAVVEAARLVERAFGTAS